MPSPAEAEEGSDGAAKAEGNKRSAKSNAPPGRESGPQAYGISVNIERIVLRHVNYFGIGWLNLHLIVLVVNPLLRRSAQIARCFGFVTQVLNGLHYICLLVIAGVAQFLGPR